MAAFLIPIGVDAVETTVHCTDGGSLPFLNSRRMSESPKEIATVRECVSKCFTDWILADFRDEKSSKCEPQKEKGTDLVATRPRSKRKKLQVK
jgi:hypothetical protein